MPESESQKVMATIKPLLNGLKVLTQGPPCLSVSWDEDGQAEEQVSRFVCYMRHHDADASYLVVDWPLCC